MKDEKARVRRSSFILPPSSLLVYQLSFGLSSHRIRLAHCDRCEWESLPVGRGVRASAFTGLSQV